MAKNSKSKMVTRVMAAAIAAAAMFSGIASTQAAVITNVGSQLGIGDGIRSTSVVKTWDADGNNVLGTAGYYFAHVRAVATGDSFETLGNVDSYPQFLQPGYLNISRSNPTDSQSVGGNTDLDCKTFERGGLVRRNFRTDRAPETFDIEQTTVEDRIGDTSRPREMDIAGESFPGFVHEPASFIHETAAGAVDHDPVGIDQHHRR